MGVTQGAGLSLKWFKDNFCQSEVEVSNSLGEDVYEIINNQVSQVPTGCNGLLYLPYMMGERTLILTLMQEVCSLDYLQSILKRNRKVNNGRCFI